MQFVKKIYIALWQSEYDICLFDNEFYLVANKNTSFEILEKTKFEKLEDKLAYQLCLMVNHKITPDDVYDILCYNDVLCYAVKSKIANYYHMLPAIGGSGFAVDNAYISIGNWGEPTFVQIFCPICNHIFYVDTLKIPHGEMYEVKCTKCGFLSKRKNNLLLTNYTIYQRPGVS